MRKGTGAKGAHMFDGQCIHAIDFEAWDVVSPSVERAALGAPPLCCAHTCTPAAAHLQLQKERWECQSTTAAQDPRFCLIESRHVVRCVASKRTAVRHNRAGKACSAQENCLHAVHKQPQSCQPPAQCSHEHCTTTTFSSILSIRHLGRNAP